MQIEINGPLEEVINAAISSGDFNSPQEYIKEAIKSYRIQKLNEALAIGIEQLERGEGIPFDDISFEQLMEEIKQERNAHA